MTKLTLECGTEVEHVVIADDIHVLVIDDRKRAGTLGCARGRDGTTIDPVESARLRIDAKELPQIVAFLQDLISLSRACVDGGHAEGA